MSNAVDAGPSDDFLIALGALTLNWACIEAALDFAISVIMHDLRHEVASSEIPRSLKNKLGFLRRSLKHDTFSLMRAPASALISEIQAAKDQRHSLVHGALVGQPSGDIVEILRIRYEPTTHRVSTAKVTTSDVETSALTAQRLAERATAFAIGVFNSVRPENAINFPLDEFAGR